MKYDLFRLFPIQLLSVTLLLSSCAPATVPSANVHAPTIAATSPGIPSGFALSDGSRPLTFPAAFGAHEDFRTDWWYYTGNLQPSERRHFGLELTIFRVSLLSPVFCSFRAEGYPPGSALTIWTSFPFGSEPGTRTARSIPRPARRLEDY